jgi:hypothetical protein
MATDKIEKGQRWLLLSGEIVEILENPREVGYAIAIGPPNSSRVFPPSPERTTVVRVKMPGGAVREVLCEDLKSIVK